VSGVKRSKTVLRGDEILLRTWNAEDAGWYVRSRDDEVFKWTSERRDLTINEAAEAINRVNESDTIFGFAIVDDRNDEILGNIALVIDEDNRRIGEAMYWLSPWGRGRGAATIALKLLCHWAFVHMGLDMVTLKTRHGNIRSQSVAKRAGFEPMKDAKEGEKDLDNLWFVRRKQMNP